MDIHEFPPNLEASYYYKYFKYSPFVTSQCWVWKDSHLRCVLLPWIQYLESFGEAWLSCNHSSFDSWGDCRTPNLGSPYSCLHVYMAWSRGLVSSVCGRADVLVVHHGWKILWCTTSLSGHAAIVIKFLVLPPWRQGHASCSDVSPTSCTYQRVPLSQTVTSLEKKITLHVVYRHYHISWSRQKGTGGAAMSRPTRPKDTGQDAHNWGSLEDNYRIKSCK
jgi:hypothetical protein